MKFILEAFDTDNNVQRNNREKIPLNKERLFVYNKEQMFFIEELFQWIMGSYQTELLFA